MTAEEALAFVREHGVVLASAKGSAPSLAEVIAGEPIKGSWWAHPKGHLIFTIFQKIGESADVLTCRLINGKVTFVHRRLWPALVRLAEDLPTDRLAQVHQEHTPSGHHVNHDVAFPLWVPREVIEEARRLDEQEARNALGPWATLPDKIPRPPGRKKPRPAI